MGERLRTGQRDNPPNMFQLYSKVIDNGSMDALQELSSIASSNERAAQLVDRIDEAVEAGELELRPGRTRQEVENELKFAHRNLLLVASVCLGSTAGMCAEPKLAAVAAVSYPLLVVAYARFEKLQNQLTKAPEIG